VLSILLSFNDLRYFFKIHQNTITSKDWLTRHIGLMMGSFIGAVTAFLVVNIRLFQPAWLIWFAPTFILVPVMLFWTRKYTSIK
jgi:ABC-type enterochelin transport system permease subunit